jgi:hypothetical protein
MSISQTSENLPAGTSEAGKAVQQKLVHFTNSYELVRSLMNVTIQQIELSRDWMDGNVEDFNLLA